METLENFTVDRFAARRSICSDTQQQNFPMVSSVQVYDRSVSADRPNESSISLRPFRQIFGRRCMWQRSRTFNERVCSGDIEGRQKETNRIKKTVEL